MTSEFKKPTVHDKYSFQETLGKGQYGVVRRAVLKNSENEENNMEVAIKIISKMNLHNPKTNHMKEFRKEMSILKKCNHPHIVNFIESFEDDYNYYIIMEYMTEGDLFEKIQKIGFLDETLCKMFCAQIVSALKYLHSEGVAHRDLKLENLMLYGLTVKLCDFGLSAKHIKPKHDTYCGSPHYVSPEILDNDMYNPMKNDIWSLGVIIYCMFTGCFPWDGSDIFTLKYNLKNSKLKQPTQISDQAFDLLQKIFKPQKKRISLQEIEDHPWLKRYKVPTYLRVRPRVDQIDFKIVEEVEKLGFNPLKIMNDLYMNEQSVENSLYHVLLKQRIKSELQTMLEYKSVSAPVSPSNCVLNVEVEAGSSTSTSTSTSTKRPSSAPGRLSKKITPRKHKKSDSPRKHKKSGSGIKYKVVSPRKHKKSGSGIKYNHKTLSPRKQNKLDSPTVLKLNPKQYTLETIPELTNPELTNIESLNTPVPIIKVVAIKR